MKFLILSCLVFVSYLSNSQSEIVKSKIDSVNSNADANNFLSKLFEKDFLPRFEKKAGDLSAFCNRVHDSLQINNWFKTDLNNDGLTDLFFYDYNLEQMKFCIFDLDNGKYEMKMFPINLTTECVFVKPIKILGQNYLETFYQIGNTGKLDKRIVIYKFNTFVEYNPKPKKESINYVCFDMLDISNKSNAFYLKVDRQGKIHLKWYDHGGQLKEIKENILDSALVSMFELADYTDFLAINYDHSKISEEYYNGKLIFGYKKNSTKEIKFYNGIFEHFIIREIIGYFYRKKFELVID